jgi:N-ethylmaleimide reductase
VERLRTAAPIAPADEATYYQGGDEGYLTYPAYQYTTAA